MTQSTTQVPENILTAVNTLLAPFGMDLHKLMQPERQQHEDSEKYLTIDEVEKRYKIKRHTLARRIADKLIDAVKMSGARAGKVLVSKASLEAYLAGATI